jgi:hypothetical protein
MIGGPHSLLYHLLITTNSSNEYFYNNAIGTSSDESDGKSDILIAMALLVHHQEQHLPK